MECLTHAELQCQTLAGILGFWCLWPLFDGSLPTLRAYNLLLNCSDPASLVPPNTTVCAKPAAAGGGSPVPPSPSASPPQLGLSPSPQLTPDGASPGPPRSPGKSKPSWLCVFQASQGWCVCQVLSLNLTTPSPHLDSRPDAGPSPSPYAPRAVRRPGALVRTTLSEQQGRWC